ncbi:MAG: MarR family winged helix-turn-helix transcriptional regulator [Candidatus Dactylopiibacterium sp.]|nr:MarR family winged helix-turn-helix transcriptional regulator [Candidatus Dactylopiibacterium sp.]
MTTDLARLLSETVVALFRANGKMLEWGDAFTAPAGLTSARWQILGAIARAGRHQTAPHIAEQMGITRQGAQKQLNLLIADGLIERLPNPAHQRSPQYRLTEAGASLFERVNAAWQAHAARTGDAFSAEALEITLRTLDAISRLHGVPARGDHDAA